ncbi:hypothetical protein BDW66DRAFT_153826 [Aspergillus desertorum]
MNDSPNPEAAFEVRYAEPRTPGCPRPKRQLDINRLAIIKEKRVRFAPDITEYSDRKPRRSSPLPADTTRPDLTSAMAENDSSELTTPPTLPAVHVQFAAEISIIPRPDDSFDHVLSAIDFNTTHLDSAGKTCPVMQRIRFADAFTDHNHAHDVFRFVGVQHGETGSASPTRRPRCAGVLERSPSLDKFAFVAENCRRRKRRLGSVCGKVRGLFKGRKSKIVL